MAELANMNRLATAGQLSASIAHEINQPITGIVLKASAGLRWLAADKPDVDKVRNVLSDIVGAGQRAGDIINSVRAMFKKDENAKAPINLNNLVNTVLALLRLDLQRDDVRVETRLDEALPAVTGDPVQLQQVILNLIVNAADAMRSGEPRVLKIQTSRIAGRVHVAIEDTGPGVAELGSRAHLQPAVHDQGGRYGDGTFDLPLDHRKPRRPHLGGGRDRAGCDLSIRIARARKPGRQPGLGGVSGVSGPSSREEA